MNARELLDEILAILSSVKENRNKLEAIHKFFITEIYEEPEKTEIPEKYRKLVHDIAENIDCGLINYLNLKTLEIFAIPTGILDDMAGFDDEGLWQTDLDKAEKWENSICIEPLESSESFKIMESFVGRIDNQKLQDKLLTALERKKPFATFKNLIDYSDYRQDWFDYKQEFLEEHVFDILKNELNI